MKLLTFFRIERTVVWFPFWIFVSALLLTGCASNQEINTSRASTFSGLPVVQGLTNSHATQISVVAPRNLNLKFSYSNKTSESKTPVISSIHESPGSTIVVHHLKINHLQIGTTYSLEIRNENDALVDQRDFQSLDLSERPARIVAASCLYDRYLNESVRMWKAVLESKPDLLLLIGDNVYAEVSDGRFSSPLNESALWIRYTETFQALDLYRSPRLLPTLVTWDDHDYGMKDGNRENPHQIEAKKVLSDFFPQQPDLLFPEFQSGPGVSSKFDAFGYRFLLLDGRSFRSPKGLSSLLQTHFGVDQEKWIFSKIRETDKPTWLISGDQWFGGYHKFESYEGSHPESFKQFLKSINNTKASILFLSGDRHLSEVSRIEKKALGYETFEFTSSSLHSKTHPSNWATIPNKRQVYGVDMQHAFTQFDLTPKHTDHSVRIRGATIGAESKVLYKFDFEINRSAR